jgi:autophagy-related protein 9
VVFLSGFFFGWVFYCQPCAQAEHMMCIHKEELTELDVYHRILRFDNYLVAMVNKSLLPLRFTLPIVGGDYVFLSRGLKFNLELILFRSPYAPFKQWNLREDYKRVAKRKAGLRIRINLSCWIRIRIQIADPDPGEEK